MAIHAEQPTSYHRSSDDLSRIAETSRTFGMGEVFPLKYNRKLLTNVIIIIIIIITIIIIIGLLMSLLLGHRPSQDLS
jgi:hypothetical protein